MCVHQYSGASKLLDNVTISAGYVGYLFFVRFFSARVREVSPAIFWFGFVLFFVGESVNYYHHIILSRLRADGSKEYKVCSIYTQSDGLVVVHVYSFFIHHLYVDSK